jgi:hypothetical protein
LRLFAIAGRLVHGRRLHLRIPARWPCARQIITALTRPHALPAPT